MVLGGLVKGTWLRIWKHKSVALGLKSEEKLNDEGIWRLYVGDVGYDDYVNCYDDDYWLVASSYCELVMSLKIKMEYCWWRCWSVNNVTDDGYVMLRSFLSGFKVWSHVPSFVHGLCGDGAVQKILLVD